MPFPVHSRRRAVPLLLAACALIGDAAAPAAHAGPYEQISRATGADGSTRFLDVSRPVAVSDSGRRSVLESTSLSALNFNPEGPTFVRDIVTNTTSTLAGPGEDVAGFTANEQLALVIKDTPTGTSVILRPTGGGADRILGAFPELGGVTGAISGSGSTVAVSDGRRTLYVVDVRSGGITRHRVARAAVGPRSLSDDGRVIVGTRDSYQGFSLINGRLALLDRSAYVSPNGGVIVSTVPASRYDQPMTVIARRVADGLTKTFSIPPAQVGNIGWIAPDGSRVMISPSFGTGARASILTLRSGAITPFGGAFAADLVGIDLSGLSPTSAMVSRNGRYAVFMLNGIASQSILADLTGRDLPGDQEPLSASAYAYGGFLAAPCAENGRIVGSFERPGMWVAQPRSAEVVVTADGTEVYRQTFTDANAPRQPMPSDPDDINTGEIGEFPPTTQRLEIRVTVVDGAGRTLVSTEAVDHTCRPAPVY